MIRTGYIFGMVLTLLWIGIASAQQTLTFTQIVDTPDQAIGAVIVKSAYEKLGILVKFAILPGKRALAESSEGRADGEVHRIFEIGDEYPTLLRVPTPINYIEPSVFSKKHGFEVTDCTALQGYQIGIVRGVKHSQLCTQGIENVFAGDDLSGVMRMLDAGRVGLLITARVNGMLMAKELGLDAIKPLSPPLSRLWVYHYLHERHKELVPTIDAVFKAMQERGELEALREQAAQQLLQKAGKQD
ncbi:MAG: transporter substrate-binding domain-containing protein [Deltaproteobacteria bacterium]|nr:transporter substrate-binding domain-containing protein [Deltaproteobacteria bacterium]